MGAFVRARCTGKVIFVDLLIMIIAMTLILGFLVFIHEGGHFLVARAFGVRVTEFMIGLPGPSIGFTRGETRFGVTAVPLGGYANVCGMAPPSNSPHLKRVLGYVYRKGEVYSEDVAYDLCMSDAEAIELLEELADWGSIKRPNRKDEYSIYRTPAKKNLPEGSARPVADLQSFYEHERSCQYAYLPFWKRSAILLAGPAMNLLWVLLVFIVVYSIMGLDLKNTATGEVFHYNWAPWDAISMGISYLGMVISAIAGLFNPVTAADTISQSTSIIGIAVMSKSALEAGFQNFLFFSAVISASLGFMNMLPIPPLDGGRFVVEVFQKISRRIVSMRALGYLSMTGVALFAVLLVVMVNQDIQRFVLGNWG